MERKTGKEIYDLSKEKVKYLPLSESTPEVYSEMGFKSGLEVHQQLLTKEKLFCRCPSGIYQGKQEYDAEVLRHMRPTMSEMGGYDGTALMEFKTRKNIWYRINNKNTCTYEIDDAPPFPINQKALDISVEVCLLLNTNIVSEVHVSRKQYLDGSIPAGFQRTAIVGVEGKIPLKKKDVGIIQLSIEEDSCREISDVGHNRVYRTDRLGMPLIEVVTYPDMLTPEEVVEAGTYIRYLCRSTGHVRTGMGTAREDVNVSIAGGTRIEIKGVPHIKWFKGLVHNEAFRQKSLLMIKDYLNETIENVKEWKISHLKLNQKEELLKNETLSCMAKEGKDLYLVNLKDFGGILGHFTQPSKTFADEISDRLKVIACLQDEYMIHSEDPQNNYEDIFNKFAGQISSSPNDAQIIFAAEPEDVETALETIEERCQMAFTGVPNETRRALNSELTMFERVLPGADRMYPDTDSPPIPLEWERVQDLKSKLPISVKEVVDYFQKWQIPENYYNFLLRNNFFTVLKEFIDNHNIEPKFVGSIFGQNLRNYLRQNSSINFTNLKTFIDYLTNNKIDKEILKDYISDVVKEDYEEAEALLKSKSFKTYTEDEINEELSKLVTKYKDKKKFKENNDSFFRFLMGTLRKKALGNVNMAVFADRVREVINE